MKTTIIYWTNTGNTEKMAELIKKGLDSSNKSVESIVKTVANAKAEDIRESDILLLGCPAMGVEEIDSSEMEPFIKMNAKEFEGKSVALFGSYGWGTGEWMENWESMISDMGAKIITNSLTVNESPEGQDEAQCIEYGKKISEL